jgi:hypothetical protein
MAYSKEFQDYYDYIKEITNGVFSVCAPHRDLFQVKDCEWSVVYDMLHKLSYDSAEVDIKVKREDFAEVEGPTTYDVIAKAIEESWGQY